jgi:hypothetical protein
MLNGIFDMPILRMYTPGDGKKLPQPLHFNLSTDTSKLLHWKKQVLNYSHLSLNSYSKNKMLQHAFLFIDLASLAVVLCMKLLPSD